MPPEGLGMGLVPYRAFFLGPTRSWQMPVAETKPIAKPFLATAIRYVSRSTRA